VPEKWFPGRFDFWLHSHQIFHIFVVLGCYLHYLASLELVSWRDASGGCALELTQRSTVHEAARDQSSLIDLDGMVDIFQEKLSMLWQEHSSNTAALKHALASDGVDVAGIQVCAWDDAQR
jgi:Haemolysin-III related